MGPRKCEFVSYLRPFIRSFGLFYPYNNREDGVGDSNLHFQLTLDINLQCLYATNWSHRLKTFSIKY